MERTDNKRDITGNVSAVVDDDVLNKPEFDKSEDCDTFANAAAGQSDKSKKKVLIIGAGAAGMMAAISAAECGARVTVLEHKDRPGIKLAVTGNGRCNYTNTHVSAAKYHCDSEALQSFIEAVLEQFGYEECISFFKSIGINPLIRHYSYDDSGYVYPEDMNAQDFRDTMYKAALKQGVNFRFGVSDTKVIETVLSAVASSGLTNIADTKETVDKLYADNSTCLDGVKANAQQSLISSNTDETAYAVSEYDAVIIAAGSNAYPVTGSDSSIYPLLKQLGIKQERFLPALCALYSKDEYLKTMKGKRVKTEAKLKLYEASVRSGEDNTANKDKACTCSEYYAAGEIQFNEHSISGIPVMQLSRYAAKALNEGRKAVLSIDGHDYVIHRTAGFDRAQTCTGGISAGELDPHTMRHSSGLYFCGEIIDIDGECGGYNLQFAWSTGYIAGRAAASNRL